MPRAGGAAGHPYARAPSTDGVDDPVDKHWACTPKPALVRPATRCLRIHQRGASTAGLPARRQPARPLAMRPRPGRANQSTATVDDPVEKACACRAKPMPARLATRCLRIDQWPRRGRKRRPQSPQPAWMTLWITPVQPRQSQHWRGLQRGACEFISSRPPSPPRGAPTARLAYVDTPSTATVDDPVENPDEYTAKPALARAAMRCLFFHQPTAARRGTVGRPLFRPWRMAGNGPTAAPRTSPVHLATQPSAAVHSQRG